MRRVKQIIVLEKEMIRLIEKRRYRFAKEERKGKHRKDRKETAIIVVNLLHNKIQI